MSLLEWTAPTPEMMSPGEISLRQMVCALEAERDQLQLHIANLEAANLCDPPGFGEQCDDGPEITPPSIATPFPARALRQQNQIIGLFTFR